MFSTCQLNSECLFIRFGIELFGFQKTGRGLSNWWTNSSNLCSSKGFAVWWVGWFSWIEGRTWRVFPFSFRSFCERWTFLSKNTDCFPKLCCFRPPIHWQCLPIFGTCFEEHRSFFGDAPLTWFLPWLHLFFSKMTCFF